MCLRIKMSKKTQRFNVAMTSFSSDIETCFLLTFILKLTKFNLKGVNTKYQDQDLLNQL